MKITTILLIVMIVAGVFVVQVNNLDVTKVKGMVSLAQTMWDWISGATKNTVDVVGYAAEKDWLPDINSTNSTK